MSFVYYVIDCVILVYEYNIIDLIADSIVGLCVALY